MQAGATAVVPETLEPSLQLASAVLSQLNMPQDGGGTCHPGLQKKPHLRTTGLCRLVSYVYQGLGANTDLCCTHHQICRVAQAYL